MEYKYPRNALYIICPFCRLEYSLRAKFGADIFFVTVSGGVINFHSDETLGLDEFLKREQITDIYLVNDVSCNFIKEAINSEKGFGLHCEKHLRELSKKISDDIDKLSVNEKKELLAKTNVLTQLNFLNSHNLIKDETSQINIKVHGMIINENRGFEIIN